MYTCLVGMLRQYLYSKKVVEFNLFKYIDSGTFNAILNADQHVFSFFSRGFAAPVFHLCDD